jgi:hypothetical protein
MATSPNFGWLEPDNTDLVKNGALAIRTLGNAIDASLVDLKGGTTNQVLAKNSNTDMDFKWVADASGIPATIIDAKGDLIAGTAADTAARLAVGTNGQVLTADSAEATGLKWATASSGTPAFVGTSVTKSTTQSIANATYTVISWDGEEFDTDAFHDNSTNNSRITIPSGKAGKYLITANLNIESGGGNFRIISIYKNGTATGDNTIATVSGFTTIVTKSIVMNLAVGDYIQVYIYQNSGGALNINGTSLFGTLFQATYLGA